jgi:hypothetical protein
MPNQHEKVRKAAGNRGQGRKPGVPNKATAELKHLACQYTPAALEELARLSTQAQSEQARVSAIKELLDRGYGKATQMIAGDKDADPLQLETSMTDVAKLLLLKIGGE